MKSIHAGQLVTVTEEGVTLDGIVFDTPNLLKVVVAVPDPEGGAVFRTVRRGSLSERREAGEHDAELRKLIRRSPRTSRSGPRGADGPRRGHMRGAAHRTTSK
jgi:hypothetical protein